MGFDEDEDLAASLYPERQRRDANKQKYRRGCKLYTHIPMQTTVARSEVWDVDHRSCSVSRAASSGPCPDHENE